MKGHPVSVAALEELADSFLQEQPANQPDMLWHYTNAAGFLGILRSGKLWATHTDYLNDASEMRYAKRLLLNAVSDSRSSAQNDEEHEMLNNFCNCIGSGMNRNVFVTSLSAAQDDLSQWRAYGGGTGSFALGFHVSCMLVAIKENTETPFSLYKCIYEESTCKDLCRKFVDRMLEAFRKEQAKPRPGSDRHTVMTQLIQDAVEIFDKMAPMIKHPDFSSENEWRLVCRDVDLKKLPIRLREGKTEIIPYIELTIAKDKTEPRFTVHTQVGPSIRHNPRNTNLALIGYCGDFILAPFPIQPISTPYRHV